MPATAECDRRNAARAIIAFGFSFNQGLFHAIASSRSGAKAVISSGVKEDFLNDAGAAA